MLGILALPVHAHTAAVWPFLSMGLHRVGGMRWLGRRAALAKRVKVMEAEVTELRSTVRSAGAVLTVPPQRAIDTGASSPPSPRR